MRMIKKYMNRNMDHLNVKLIAWWKNRNWANLLNTIFVLLY